MFIFLSWHQKFHLPSHNFLTYFSVVSPRYRIDYINDRNIDIALSNNEINYILLVQEDTIIYVDKSKKTIASDLFIIVLSFFLFMYMHLARHFLFARKKGRHVYSIAYIVSRIM